MSGDPDEGHDNGDVLDSHNVNASVVGSSVGDESAAAGAPADGGEPDAGTFDAGGYDPGEDTVADVRAYVDRHPDQLATVLAAERAGKARSSLLDDLERRDADDDE